MGAPRHVVDAVGAVDVVVVLGVRDGDLGGIGVGVLCYFVGVGACCLLVMG